jgi:hypothetical protein
VERHKECELQYSIPGICKSRDLVDIVYESIWRKVKACQWLYGAEQWFLSQNLRGDEGFATKTGRWNERARYLYSKTYNEVNRS